MTIGAPIFIDAEKVRSIPFATALLAAMREAMIAVSQGAYIMPQRMITPIGPGALLAVMPGAATNLGVYGAKIVNVHPDNAASGMPVIQGHVLLFDARNGQPIAIVEAAELTARRTAAVTALATQLLASPGSRSHGIFGTGAQAFSHAEAVAAAMPGVERIVIWGRSLQKAEALARRIDEELGLDAEPTEDPSTAARCNIVTCVTSATSPLLKGAWLESGAHVNLVGAHSATAREADAEVLNSSRIYVDQRAAAEAEAGDIILWMSECGTSWNDVAGEIGSVANGDLLGRTNDTEITVFKSVGIAIQDVYAAAAALHAEMPNNRG